ncbi:T9SS type A sorting domain-containing protein, partial [bacterium]|nr:T9SS type A sorting domain-containing protein [bacterium]
DVPSNNVVLTYCYDKCKTCGGDDPILAISTPQSVSNFAVYPNPTSGNTKFAYTLEQTEQVTLNVYNMLGAVVATVYGGTQPAGTYTLEVSLANLDHGMYIYKMQVGDSSTQGQIVKQ